MQLAGNTAEMADKEAQRQADEAMHRNRARVRSEAFQMLERHVEFIVNRGIGGNIADPRVHELQAIVLAAYLSLPMEPDGVLPPAEE